MNVIHAAGRRIRIRPPVDDLSTDLGEFGSAGQGISPNGHLRRQMVDLYRHGAVPALLSLLCACGLVALLWKALPASEPRPARVTRSNNPTAGCA